MMFALSVFLLGAFWTSVGLCQNASVYTNPILDTVGADPWVIRHDGWYYMTYTTNDNITLLRSKILTDWNTAERKLLFLPPPGHNYSTDLWAPELHLLSGKWYVIFTADPNHDNPLPDVDMYCDYNCPAIYHRMYVLEGSAANTSTSTSTSTSDYSTSTDDSDSTSSDSSTDDSSPDPSPWDLTYTLKSELSTYNQFAIDGTYLVHNSQLYHIYSCWYDAVTSWPSNLCITRLTNPWTVSSPLADRSTISVPTEPWEKTPTGRIVNDRLSTNEGPEVLRNRKTGQLFLIYSAGRSDNRNYCLGQLELVGDTSTSNNSIESADPMLPSHWVKHPGCVFYQDDANSAYGVGHASFTTSPDGDEDWVVYHGMRDPRYGWAARTIRTQRFYWGDDGAPRFPRPGYGPYSVPGGQVGS